MADVGVAQEEVWDDTDLLQSWNEAFAEYKKYHSIAAKGGKVSPSPSADQNGLTNGNNPTSATNTQDALYEDADSDDYEPSLDLLSKNGQAPNAGMTAAAAAMPQALLANVQDDNMKNIMMSWYYAGYYTGLYEGKQQGYQSAMQQQQEGG